MRTKRIGRYLHILFEPGDLEEGRGEKPQMKFKATLKKPVYAGLMESLMVVGELGLKAGALKEDDPAFDADDDSDGGFDGDTMEAVRFVPEFCKALDDAMVPLSKALVSWNLLDFESGDSLPATLESLINELTMDEQSEMIGVSSALIGGGESKN